MKQSISAFVTALILTACVSSCDSHAPLRQEVAETQRAMPLSLGIFGDISSVEYNDSDNLVTIGITPGNIIADTLSLIDLYGELSPGFALLMMRENLPALLDRAVTDCASLVITIAGQPCDTIPPSRLEKALADSTAALTPHERAIELLGLAIASERKSLPATAPQPEPTQGAVTASCRLEGKNVIYDIVIDDESWDNISFSDSCALIVGRDVLPASANRDGLLSYIVNARRNYTLNFTSYPTATRTVTLTFAPDSLARIINIR